MQAALWLSISFTSIAATSSAGVLGDFSGSTGLFVNDYIGDGRDRWRTGSKWESFFFENGPIAKELELRLHAQIVSPHTPAFQGDTDRLYVDSFGFAAYAHTSVGALDLRYGAEVLVTGSQTGLADLQELTHDVLGLDQSFVLSEQDVERIENEIHGLVELEAGWKTGFASLMIRPFVAVQAGYEKKSIVGVDFALGPANDVEVWSRDPVTGALMPVNSSQKDGVTFILGADISDVSESIYFPETIDTTLMTNQVRARAGISYQTGNVRLFAGQAWLGKEFEEQYEAQRVGLIAFDLVY